MVIQWSIRNSRHKKPSAYCSSDSEWPLLIEEKPNMVTHQMIHAFDIQSEQ